MYVAYPVVDAVVTTDAHCRTSDSRADNIVLFLRFDRFQLLLSADLVHGLRPQQPLVGDSHGAIPPATANKVNRSVHKFNKP